MSARRMALAGLWLALFVSTAAGQDPAATFHKAYYLEVDQGDLEAAAKLYEEVAGAPGAPAELAQKARKRLEGAREQIRGRDLARLMPADIIAYAELRRPGEHLARLIQMSGLVLPEGDRAEGPAPGELPLVSPRLLEALKGLEGAAVAIAEFDPRGGPPQGVVVLNAGRHDLLHGLIETGLSTAVAAQALQPAPAVDGHRAYISPIGALVVTERFIIAGNPPELAFEATRRLSAGEPGLSASPGFAELAAERGDSLLFAFVNGQRVIEKLKREVFQGQEPEEYRLAQAFGDIESLQWASLRIGAGDRGLATELRLRLADGNRSIAYHLLRTPPLTRDALKKAPAGAAALLAFHLSAGPATGAPGEDAAAPITGLEIGRELFANIGDVVAYALPWAEAGPNPEEGGGPPIPDIGIVLSVKDPARSQSLWAQILSIPAMILHTTPRAAGTEQVDGREVRIFEFPEGFRLRLATLPDRLVFATSARALSGAFGAADGKGSALEDAELQKTLASLPPDACKILVVHAGRAWRTLQPMMGPGPQEAAMIAALLKDTTAVLLTRESPVSLSIGLTLGIPQVGELLKQLASREHRPAPPARRRAGPSKSSSKR